MPEDPHHQRVHLDIASVFNSGVPVKGPAITLREDWLKSIECILEYERRPIDLIGADLLFEIYTARGKHVASLPFVLGDSGWALELPASGRVGWQLSGSREEFLGIEGFKKPEECEWRIRGDLRGEHNVTAIRGRFVYLRTTNRDELPDDSDNDLWHGRPLPDALEMFLQFRVQSELFYTTYEYDDDEQLVVKTHWDTPSMAHKLFVIDYTYDACDQLTTKTIRRMTDGKLLVLHYSYDADEFLTSVARTHA